MDFAHPATLLLPAGIAALIAWRVYRRVRRMVGRQRFSGTRAWLTVVFFPLLVGLLLLGSLAHPEAALCLAGGVLVGCVLGWYGIRFTRFEQTPLGLFYTPNAHIGIALSLLLVGRLAYRGIVLYAASGAIAGDSAAFARSPLTLAIFGTVAGYYVAYAVGLLRWKRRAARVDPPAASGTTGA